MVLLRVMELNIVKIDQFNTKVHGKKIINRARANLTTQITIYVMRGFILMVKLVEMEATTLKMEY